MQKCRFSIDRNSFENQSGIVCTRFQTDYFDNGRLSHGLLRKSSWPLKIGLFHENDFEIHFESHTFRTTQEITLSRFFKTVACAGIRIFFYSRSMCSQIIWKYVVQYKAFMIIVFIFFCIFRTVFRTHKCTFLCNCINIIFT